MAALEARMTARDAQIPNAKSQTPKDLAIEVIEDDVVVAAYPAAANGIVDRAGASFAEATVDKTEPRDAAFHPEADAPWPGTADEASFLADQRGQGIAPPDAATGLASEPTDLSPLPSLEELVQRIPAEARAALDDLFRAKFTSVRRVSKKMLKT